MAILFLGRDSPDRELGRAKIAAAGAALQDRRVFLSCEGLCGGCRPAVAGPICGELSVVKTHSFCGSGWNTPPIERLTLPTAKAPSAPSAAPREDPRQ